jgi:hypothetical protein
MLLSATFIHLQLYTNTRLFKIIFVHTVQTVCRGFMINTQSLPNIDRCTHSYMYIIVHRNSHRHTEIEYVYQEVSILI